MTIALLLAMVVTSLICRRQYKPGCFMLWLGLWILVGSIFAISGFYTILILATGAGSSWSNLFEAILMLALIGSIFGLCLYMLNLPFMILGFANAFFRERFCACLRLKAMPAAPQQADIGRLNEQNPGTEIPEKGDST